MRSVKLWWAVAGTTAFAGVIAVLVRPIAPDPGPVATDLARFSPMVLDAVADYRTERYLGALGVMIISVVVPASFVLAPWGRRAVARLGERTGRPLVGAGIVAAVIALSTAVAELPLRFWSGYLHERAWGFATASAWDWMRDWALVHGVVLVVAVVGASVFIAFRRRWADTWHLRLVVVGTVLTAILVLVYPWVVQPLLLPTERLPDGPVRDAVAEVLVRAGEEGLEISVGDASRRTTKVNAFVTGIGPSRQIVLFDTLLELPPDQVAVVAAHELAHREHRDVPRATLATAAGLLVGLVVLRRLVGPDGGRRRVDDPRAVAILALLLTLGQIVVAPVTNWTSRRAEAAADHRALELTGAAPRLVAAQRGFVVRDLADPAPPAWVMALWGTHPSIEERIQRAVAFARTHDIALPPLDEFVAEEPEPPTPRGP